MKHIVLLAIASLVILAAPAHSDDCAGLNDVD